MKTIIHVNQHKIKRNKRLGKNEPCLTVKTYKSNDYAHTVHINGPSSIVYSPNKPLNCGAVCWVETQAEVTLDPKEIEKEISIREEEKIEDLDTKIRKIDLYRYRV